MQYPNLCICTLCDVSGFGKFTITHLDFYLFPSIFFHIHIQSIYYIGYILKIQCKKKKELFIYLYLLGIPEIRTPKIEHHKQRTISPTRTVIIIYVGLQKIESLYTVDVENPYLKSFLEMLRNRNLTMQLLTTLPTTYFYFLNITEEGNQQLK